MAHQGHQAPRTLPHRTFVGPLPYRRASNRCRLIAIRCSKSPTRCGVWLKSKIRVSQCSLRRHRKLAWPRRSKDIAKYGKLTANTQGHCKHRNDTASTRQRHGKHTATTREKTVKARQSHGKNIAQTHTTTATTRQKQGKTRQRHGKDTAQTQRRHRKNTAPTILSNARNSDAN